MNKTRRDFLRNAILGPAGLRAAATGLPASFFTCGFLTEEAMADGPLPGQFLLFNNHNAGDPLNVNAPGTYDVSGAVHNPQPGMEETPLQLGSVSTTAAAPWATLPQWALDRTCFISHRTYQNTHPQHVKVLGLVGAAKNPSGTGSDHFASLVAYEIRESLETLQSEPVTLGGGLTLFAGAVVPKIPPSVLARVFSPLSGELLGLANLRDQTLDAIHERLREDGTPAQRTWLDRHAESRETVKKLDEDLVARFDSITDNSANAQISAALTLFMMKVSGVVGIHVPFGGDNHKDAGLATEASETISGIASFRFLFEELQSTGLADQVTFANLGPFGRTFAKDGTEGRDHNLNHHTMMITGAHVNPGIYGGIKEVETDFGATAIDSVTGQGVEGGDIPEDETLESAARTLATILGVPPARIDARIEGGKLIEAAVAG